VCSNSPSAPIPWQPSEAVAAEADKRVSTAMAAAAAVAAAAVCRSTTGQTSPGLLLCSELVGKMSIRSSICLADLVRCRSAVTQITVSSDTYAAAADNALSGSLTTGVARPAYVLGASSRMVGDRPRQPTASSVTGRRRAIIRRCTPVLLVRVGLHR